TDVSAEPSHGGVVVRLAGDLRNELRAADGAVAVDDDDRPRGEATQRTVDELDAVVLRERRAERRERDHVVEPFGFAEALLRERKVGADHDDHGVAALADERVEPPSRGLADAGVVARVDAEDDLLAGEV